MDILKPKRNLQVCKGCDISAQIQKGNGKLRLPELLATDTSVYLRILSTVAADNDRCKHSGSSQDIKPKGLYHHRMLRVTLRWGFQSVCGV